MNINAHIANPWASSKRLSKPEQELLQLLGTINVNKNNIKPKGKRRQLLGAGMLQVTGNEVKALHL